jgi:hypothetical protein
MSEAVLVSPIHRIGTARDTELPVGRVEVVTDRLPAEAQRLGDTVDVMALD